MKLSEVLVDPARKAAVIADGVRLIEDEVSSKSGLSGLALKAAYRTVLSVRPGIIGFALGHLLPEFAPAIDPLFTAAQASGDVDGWFRTNAGRVADALLAVTDARARKAENRVLQAAYQGVRGQAQGHVVAAVPGLAKMLQRHVS